MADSDESSGTVPEWTLGDRLRKAREHAGLKQDEMAAIIEVSPATISNWETGARHPRGGELRMIHQWSEVTRVPETWLLGV
jgi:DNA-binding transcriptional regulator YiaG